MTSATVNGKQEIIPGIYSTIKSGIKNAESIQPYGNVCIIDSGAGYNPLGSSAVGIAGTRLQGENSVLEFTDIDQMRSICTSGKMWKLAESLFFPAGIRNQQIKGASKVFYVKPSATTPASLSLTLGGGAIVFTTKEEGTACNTVINSISTNPETGFAIKVSPGVINNTAIVITLYKGSFKGLDTNGLAFDGISADKTVPVILSKSPEFTTSAQLFAWANINSTFSGYITLSGTPNSTIISNTEITTIGTGWKSFTSATDTASFNNFSSCFEHLVNLDIQFFLAPDNGITAYSSTYNARLFYHLLNDAKKSMMVIGLGNNKSEFSNSLAMAASYNHERVVGVHGGYFEELQFSVSPIERSSFYKACLIMSRIAGLEPQTPITFKRLFYLSENHQMTLSEKEQAINAGVLYSNKDNDLGIVVGAGINTIQKNSFLINSEDASSYEIAIERIKSQLNKEIIVNAKKRFFGTETGANRGTATASDVKTWLRSFLDTKTAVPNQDNLIIRQGNITITVSSDTYYIEYEFVPNFPINKMVFTGIMLSA
jgi:hypothetical protein